MNFFSRSGQQSRKTNDAVTSGGITSQNNDYNNSNNSLSSSRNTQQQQQQNQSSGSGNGFTIPSISLPKGGGAIRGIDEKFATNPVTGTGSLSVPIFTSPGRSGFGPSLSLSYDSGSGNGPFGFGWSLSLPSITRKTSKGIPKYHDGNESDVFILSGAEDLVPAFKKNGNDGDWQKDENGNFIIDEHEREGYTIRKYRPRTEGLFARIERWTHKATGDVHWRSISKDNILTVYGKSAKSRIADLSDENGSESGKRVFSWLICESYDDKGNAIIYEYAKEDEKGIEDILLNINERNRIRNANKYIKRIFYGNRKPLLLDHTKESFRKSHLEVSEDDLSSADWMFDVIFDYNEGHYKEIPLVDNIPPEEQHQLVEATASDRGGIWSGRPDIFSTYRSGFEIRTYRRCLSVLMFHHFPELGTEPYLVRSTEFDYSDFDYSKQPFTIQDELKYAGSTRFASFIQNVVQSGYLKDETRPIHEVNGVKYVTYIKKLIPPLEFEYSKCIINHDIKNLDESSLENLPIGIDGSGYQFVDLDGEGVSGILTEQADTWFYKVNLGDGKFGPMEVVKTKPSIADLNNGGGGQQLMDLAGDGQLDLVDMSSQLPGFYERTNERSWENFVPFQSMPNVLWNDPNLRFVDLTGDGHADILITENEVFTWYQSLAEKGFESSTRVLQELDEEKGPRIILNDSSQSVYLADMSGDGLSDLVRIKNGEVCYWPNLGYGKFGSKITMDNSPWFDAPDQFETKKIRLADIDGSGVTDIIYIGANLDNKGIQICFNQSGNRWSDVYYLGLGLQIDNQSSIQAADLLGNGTACLIWSSPLPGHSHKTMKYLDLMGGIKPHMLVKSANNLGAETRVEYVSSTKFYLDDKTAGKPWITRLPFPVHVIERVETYDYISRNVFVTQYKYHHGYFDGIEQEFRGFGMVEQFDTEGFATLSNSDTIPKAENVVAESHIPPVYTKTWFHTGIYHGRHHVSNYFGGLVDLHDRGEYYREPAWEFDDTEARKHLLDDTTLPSGLTIDEEFEACRTLRGSMLRQEVYSKDSTEKTEHPYTVTEQNFTIQLVQPRGKNSNAIFFTHGREVINYNYERNPEDPRTSHTMTLEVDEFGNVLKQVQVGYGRRHEDPNLPLPEDREKQTEKHIIYTENDVTNYIRLVDAYRTPLQCETVTYELTGYDYTDKVGRFIESDFVKPDPTNSMRLILDFDSSVKYEDKPTEGKQRRPIEHIRTLYRKNDLSGILPLAEMECLALPGHGYRLAFTAGLIDKIYKRPDPNQPNVIETLVPNPADVLGGNGAGNGGYIASQDLKANRLFPQDDPDHHWWVPSGEIFFSLNDNDTTLEEINHAVNHFYLPHRYKDPFGNTTIVTFDSQNFLLAVKVEDAVENIVMVEGIDYRLLQPFLVTDPNQNRSMVAFDVLGMVVGTAVMGKPEPATEEGDDLNGFDNILTTKEIRNHIVDPLINPHSILKNATTRLVYDLFSYYRTKNQPDPEPPVVYTLVRETHFADIVIGNQITKIQHSFSYSDGFGREIQKKIQAERGSLDLDPSSPIADPRWVGTGWIIFNNKGKPVRQYEPFFSDTHNFEFKRLEGVSSVTFYDPVERVVAILQPNNTYEKVVFDNWKQITYDVNDTVLLDPRTDSDISNVISKYFESLPNDPDEWKTWYQERITGTDIPPEEESAARKTELHANTPTTTFFDSLGRSFIIFVHNGFREEGDSSAKQFPTRLELDIEGNTRRVQEEIIKQDGEKSPRTVMIYDYDMLGNVIHQSSMDAGERWILEDILENTIRGWDSRRHTFITQYDTLRRPIRSYVLDHESIDSTDLSSPLVERIVYGEQHPNATLVNLRGKIYFHLDQAGILSNEIYDFKGNLLSTRRQLTAQYKKKLNWKDIDNVIPVDSTATLNVVLFDQALLSMPEDDQMKETFTSNTKYDALNRPVLIETPHNDAMLPNFIKPSYNEANMLEKLDVNLQNEQQQNGEKVWTPFVINIDYDAKGRRTLIEYGSGFIENSQHGVITRYEYDELTFRLKKIITRRNLVIFSDDCKRLPDSPPRGCDIQNVHYTYDPVGNIIKISDEAQQSIFFRSHWVEPSSEYTYDPLYRLVEAKGREHLAQVGDPPVPHSYNDVPHVGLKSPNDGNLMGNYIERYLYDAIGNIESMEHYSPDQLSKPKWSRIYNYNELSLIREESNSIHNNRLSNTIIRRENINNTITEDYVHDIHGNIIRMPHLRDHPNPKDANMHYNFNDQLQQIDTRGEGTAFYVYDAAGQRIRKVWEKSQGLVEDRIYLGAFEVFRKRNGSGVLKLERETLHIRDDKQRIALVETRTQEQEPEPDVPLELIRYQFGNHLGSASLELNQKAEIISYEEYTPYGSTSFQSGIILAEVKLKRYRYAGMERDVESGFGYHGARYYAPWLGRWAKCDPKGISGGLNLYAYANNSPSVFVDVSGNEPKKYRYNWDEYEKRTNRRRPRNAPASHDIAVPLEERIRKEQQRKSRGKSGTGEQKTVMEEGGIGVSGKTGEGLRSPDIPLGSGIGKGGKDEGGIEERGKEGGGTGQRGTGKGKKEEGGKGEGGDEEGGIGQRGTKQGENTEKRESFLNKLADLAAFLSDPSSIAEAKERNTGSRQGSYLGSSGSITGPLADIMTIIVAILSYVSIRGLFQGVKGLLSRGKAGIAAVGDALADAFGWLRNKIRPKGLPKPSSPQKLLPSGAIPDTDPSHPGGPYRQPGILPEVKSPEPEVLPTTPEPNPTSPRTHEEMVEWDRAAGERLREQFGDKLK